MTIFLSSCVHDYELKPIDPSCIFHANNSKVWLINHLFKEGKDFAPLSMKYKEMLVFHKSGYCYFYQVLNFQNGHHKKADYKIDKSSKQIQFLFKEIKWKFRIKSYSIDKIILVPISASDFNYQIELIPFPEY